MNKKLSTVRCTLLALLISCSYPVQITQCSTPKEYIRMALDVGALYVGGQLVIEPKNSLFFRLLGGALCGVGIVDLFDPTPVNSIVAVVYPSLLACCASTSAAPTSNVPTPPAS